MLRQCIRLSIVCVFGNMLYGQVDSLALSSGTVAGGSVTLNLSLTSPAGNEPSALEWTLTYPSASVISVTATAGPATSAAGKALSCNQTAGALKCMATAMNSTPISNGSVASIAFTMANGAGANVNVSPVGSDSSGGQISMAATGGVITGTGGSTGGGGGGGGGTGGGSGGGAGGAPATISSVTCSPATVIAGNQIACTVALSGPAQSGGLTVTLSAGAASGNPVSVPASITIPAGASSGSFKATSSAVTSNDNVAIVATNNGIGNFAQIVVTPAFSLQCNPATVTGGASSACTVALPSAAPAGGAQVTISSGAAAATAPASMAIAAGASSGTFTVSTSTVSSGITATITATYGGSTASSSITIQSAQGLTVSSLQCSPTAVAGLDPSTCTVTLSGAAPAGGAAVSVSDNSSSASTPTSVKVPAGASSVTFVTTTAAVTANQAATLTASLGGATQTTALTIVPAVPLKSLTCALPAANGTQIMGSLASAACTLNLSGAASANQNISLKSNSAALTVPASISVPSGSSSATFNAQSGKLPSNTQAVSVTATGYGSSAAAHFTLAVLVSSLTCTPSQIEIPAGPPARCTIALSQALPSSATVAIQSNSKSLTVPATVSVTAGSSSAVFTAKTLNPPYTTTTVSANLSGISRTANITVGIPPIKSAACNPAQLSAGLSAVCTVILAGPSPAVTTSPQSGQALTITSTTTLLSFPHVVHAAVGATTATFQVTALAGYVGPVQLKIVGGMTTVTMTISSVVAHPKAGQGSSGPITSLSCSPRSIQTGGSSICQLQMNGPSSEAREIALTTSDSSILAPASVRMRRNQSMLSFHATAGPSARSGTVKIRAGTGDESVEERIFLNPSAKPAIMTPGRQAVKVGEKLSFDVSASSAAGPEPVLRADSLPEGASFDAAQGRFEWTPRESQKGDWDVVFSATDAAQQSTTAHVAIEAGSGAPVVDAVSEAASESTDAVCAPGSLAAAEGEWLSGGTESDPSGARMSLAGAKVTVNGESVPLVYSSPTRIVFICPSRQAEALSIAVETEAGRSQIVSARESDTSPGIFTADGSGRGQAAATILEGSRLAMARNYRYASEPAQPGDSLRISMTGLSANTDAGRVIVKIGDLELAADSVRPVTGWAGIEQVAVTIPAAAAAGDSVPLTVREILPDGRVVESQTATIAIEPAQR